MLRCTYIIIIHNHEDTIPALTRSLENIKDIGWKEFIFINDGSTDKSLEILQKNIKSLPNSMILTNPNIGPTATINQIAPLIRGNYVHFIAGDNIIHPDASKLLIDYAKQYNTKVVIGKMAQHNAKTDLSNGQMPKTIPEILPKHKTKLITQPLKAILRNEHDLMLGKSNSIIHASLLTKISKLDPEIYLPYLSLALLCSQESQFFYASVTVASTIKKQQYINPEFVKYTELLTLTKFTQDNTSLINALMLEMIQFLSSRKHDFFIMRKIKYWFLKYWFLKYKKYSLQGVLKLYDQEMHKLLTVSSKNSQAETVSLVQQEVHIQ